MTIIEYGIEFRLLMFFQPDLDIHPICLIATIYIRSKLCNIL